MNKFSRIGTVVIAVSVLGCLCSTVSCMMAGGDRGNAEDGNGPVIEDGEHASAEQGLEASSSHTKCSTGEPLSASSDPCVDDICTAHPECCDTTWDCACVAYVATVCGLNCNAGFTMSPEHSNMCLGFSRGTCGGAALVQLPCSGANIQRFLVEEDPVATGTYRVRSKSNDLCLTVGALGALVTPRACTGSKAQRFTLAYNGTGFYRLLDEIQGNCLKVSEGGTAAGVPVVSGICLKQATAESFRFDL